MGVALFPFLLLRADLPLSCLYFCGLFDHLVYSSSSFLIAQRCRNWQNVSQVRVFFSTCTCCHTQRLQIKLAISLNQFTDTGPASPSTDSIMPGVWQGSHLENRSVKSLVCHGQRPILGSPTLETDVLSPGYCFRSAACLFSPPYTVFQSLRSTKRRIRR